MAVNDLVELGTAEVAAETGVVTTTSQLLADAQAESLAARAALQTLLAEVGALERTEASLRRRIQAARTAAEITALTTELETAEAEIRRRRAAVAEQRRTELRATATARSAASRLERASARLTLRQVELLVAAADAQRRADDWKPALDDPDTAALPTDATALLAQLAARDAELEAVVPKRLLDAVRGRFRAAIAARAAAERAVADAEDAVDRIAEKHAGVDGDAAREGRAYARAQAEIQTLLEEGPATRAAAVDFLAETAPVLDADQLAALALASKLNARKSAAKREIDLRDAEIAEAASRAEREQAELKAIWSAGFDPAAKVAAHEADLAALDAARGQYGDSHRDTVYAWQAAAPPALWGYVGRMEDLRARLTDLQAAAPAGLDAKLGDADGDLARMLEKAFDARRDAAEVADRLLRAELRLRALREGPAAMSS